MKRRINVILLVTAILAGTGCATYQAYPGKKRPRSELALLTLSVEDPVIDGHAIDRKDVYRIELLPGRHVLDWSFTYANGYQEQRSLTFDVEAGHRYRLGQRFFPEPNPAGPLGDVFDLAVEFMLIPIKAAFPQEASSEPPAGEYHVWIIDSRSERIVAGMAPNVPLDHAPVTYVPLEGQE